MKDRPILFSAPMVRAILFGTKTQTRRVVKLPHGVWETSASGDLVPIPVGCKYGKPGDHLWVRETFNLRTGLGPVEKRLSYRADNYLHMHGWTPSIHMPRFASRILLEITGVRVERLQDISYEDALAEGMPDGARWIAHEAAHISGENPEQTARRLRWPQRWYETLWNEINGPGSWDVNPWVWVIEFRRSD